MKSKITLRIVVASPSDVEPEVSSLQDVIQGVNRTLELAGKDILLQLARWKTDVYPGFHVDGPQALIDEILKPEQSDILVGVFWRSFGSAGKDGKSGTEHEVQLACDAAAKGGQPHIMLYFSQAPYSPRSAEETDEWSKVLRFKKECRPKALYSDYQPENFKERIRDDLLTYIFTTFPAAPIPEISVTANPTLVRSESIVDLVGDVSLRIRGYAPGTYDIRLFLNTAVTNRLISGETTDAYLCSDTETPTIRGQVSQAQSGAVLFAGVPICSSELDLRIQNVRANISSHMGDYPVVGALSIQPSNTTVSPVTVGPSFILAFVKSALAFKAWSADSGKLPAQLPFTDGVNVALLDTVSTSDVPITVYFQFSELMPAFFKTLAEEGPSADSGTRFKVAFANIPSGTQVFVTTRDIPAAKDDLPKAVLLVSELSNLAQDVVAPKISRTTVGGVSLAEVTVQNGAGAAIWEWVSANPLSPSVLDDLVFGMVVANPGETLPFLTMLVYGHLAPNSNDFNASASAHIPRFVKAGVGSITCVSFQVGREDAILAITGGVPSKRI